MPIYAQLEASLTKHLALDLAPVAVAFRKDVPAGVPRFTGSAPSGCSFWKRAADLPAGKSAFATVPADHHGCPVGSYTHRIEMPAARASELMDTLGLMTKVGYLSMD